MAREEEFKNLPDNIKHWKQLKDSPYLGSWDLPADGSPVKVKIAQVKMENVVTPPSFKKEWKQVATFEKRNKRLILNQTNMGAIASWAGDDPHNWPGVEVNLIRTTTRAKGEIVECVRIVPNDKAKAAERSRAATAAAE